MLSLSGLNAGDARARRSLAPVGVSEFRRASSDRESDSGGNQQGAAERGDEGGALAGREDRTSVRTRPPARRHAYQTHIELIGVDAKTFSRN